MLLIRGQRMCRPLPAAAPKSIREVVQREPGLLTFSQTPTGARNAAAAIIYNLERPQLRYFLCQIYASIGAGLLNLTVAFPAQAQKVVVLTHYLAPRAREIQRKGWHVAA